MLNLVARGDLFLAAAASMMAKVSVTDTHSTCISAVPDANDFLSGGSVQYVCATSNSTNATLEVLYGTTLCTGSIVESTPVTNVGTCFDTSDDDDDR
jgi:hypothetical protein